MGNPVGDLYQLQEVELRIAELRSRRRSASEVQRVEEGTATAAKHEKLRLAVERRVRAAQKEARATELALASAEATSANWLTRSSMRRRAAPKCAVASNVTGATTRFSRRGWKSSGKRVTPDLPCRSRSKKFCAPLPSGETTPRPVMATRRKARPLPITPAHVAGPRADRYRPRDRRRSAVGRGPGGR